MQVLELRSRRDGLASAALRANDGRRHLGRREASMASRRQDGGRVAHLRAKRETGSEVGWISGVPPSSSLLRMPRNGPKGHGEMEIADGRR